jgi:four helix bundle protein
MTQVQSTPVHRTSLFLHERLLAYQVAREFYQSARAIARQLPRGLAELGDQLSRAARSSCLAIAEGANARSVRIKRCHFERALASYGEAAACLDQVVDEGAAPVEMVRRARELVERATRLVLGLLR